MELLRRKNMDKSLFDLFSLSTFLFNFFLFGADIPILALVPKILIISKGPK